MCGTLSRLCSPAAAAVVVGWRGRCGTTRTALNALREQLEEEMERNRQLEVAPGEVPVLPEFLQASELRYISRMVQNKLVGGVVS